MAIPKDLEVAYEGLVKLVARISQREITLETLGENVDEWRRADCRGAATLTGAAIRTLQYKLSSLGLKEPTDDTMRDLQSLKRVEATLEAPDRPGGVEGNETAALVEVPLPEGLREVRPNGRGFRLGELQIIFEPSDGPPHGHLSVSHPSRYPTFAELLRASEAPGGPPPNLWAWVPKPEERRNLQPNVVHLYVLPPEDLLG